MHNSHVKGAARPLAPLEQRPYLSFPLRAIECDKMPMDGDFLRHVCARQQAVTAV
jgi:hypothetical protein